MQQAPDHATPRDNRNVANGDRTDWPVIIVGAGPTGLTLANLLANRGIDVLVIERNGSTVQEPRAVSIDDESLRTMQAVGIVDEVMASSVLGYGSQYFSPSRKRFLHVRPSSRVYGFPKRNAFRQPVLEAQLRAHLANLPQAKTWFDTEVVGIAQDDARVTVQVRRADGSEAELTCCYLAGCDGARSFVRHTLGVEMVGSTFRERWLIIDLEEASDIGRDTAVFCNPERPCLALPGPNRTKRYEMMLHEGETDEEMLEPEMVKRLLRLYGTDESSFIRRKVVYTFHARMAERWQDRRIVLAGDAAHISPPFAGQGMNSGVRDALNLGWKLAAIVSGELGPRLLETYAEERRGHAWDMIKLAMRMGRVMMPRNHVSALAMQVGFRLLGLYAPARDYFAEMKYKPKPRFRQGFVVASQAGDKKYPLVGGLLPQAEVANGEGNAPLLDDFLGTGLTLLAPPGTSPALFDQVPDDFMAPLRIDRVAVLAQDEQGRAPQDVRTARDETGALTRLLQVQPPGLLLLRPDRYVAGFLPAKDVAGALPLLQTLVGVTW